MLYDYCLGIGDKQLFQRFATSEFTVFLVPLCVFQIRRNTFETPHRAHNPPPDLFHRPRFVSPAVDSDELRRASLIKNVAPLSIPSSSGLRQTYSGSPMDTPGSSVSLPTPLLPQPPLLEKLFAACFAELKRTRTCTKDRRSMRLFWEILGEIQVFLPVYRASSRFRCYFEMHAVWT